MEHFYCHICFVVFLMCADVVRSQVTLPFKKVVIMPGKRHLTDTGQYQVLDKIHCCHVCNVDDNCVSASYNDNTNECTKSNSNSISTNTVDDVEWAWYLVKGEEEVTG